MRYGGYFQDKDISYNCERCGEPIRNVWIGIDDNGEMHYFGSTCINIVTHTNEADRNFLEGMNRYLKGEINLNELAVLEAISKASHGEE